MPEVLSFKLYLLKGLCHVWYLDKILRRTTIRVSSRNFILGGGGGGGKLTDHVAIRPRQGEGRLLIIILWEVGSVWGEASPAPPSLDET